MYPYFWPSGVLGTPVQRYSFFLGMSSRTPLLLGNYVDALFEKNIRFDDMASIGSDKHQVYTMDTYTVAGI